MKKFTFLLTILLLFAFTSWGQTTIDSQGFETDLSGYTHTPSQIPADDPGDQYFYRAEPSDPAIYEGSVGPYTNVTGSWLFVGSNPNTINGGSPGILSLDPITVTGYTDLEFHADFGACDNDWDTSDELLVEYNFDGGTWTTLFYFVSPVTNDPLVLTGNATGGINTANGTVLTYDLATISSDNFTGSGTTLNIRIVQDADANYEAFGVDNIQIKGTAAGGVYNPSDFAAATGGTDQIDLSWTQNANTDDVMVAYTLDGTFGTPVDATSYAVDDAIPGGGTVIYNESGTSTSHTSLTANTVYYYKAWSVDGTVTYSSGVTTDNTTLAAEPTTDAVALPATTDGPTAISVNWTDASGAPDNYLIKGGTDGYEEIGAPIDGTIEADGILVQNVAAGVGTFQFTGLTPGTTYYFNIYPYNGDNGSANYKTDSPAQASEITDSFDAPIAWINEIHYDNDGGDLNEFIEIVIEDAGTYTLSDFQVNLYNGSNGESYSSETLDNFVEGNSEGNFTFFTWSYSGIQNGAPDGLALSYQGVLISGQFLSYEGDFTATDGPASGVTSTDIGVSENGSPIGESLQLKGGGSAYDMFFWVDPAAETPGALNNTQFFGDYTTWSGATDNDWATAANWLNGVPDVTLGAVIPQDLTNYPTLGAAGTCLSLYMESNASLVGVDNLAVSGTATIEQTINEYTSASDGYHFLSSPVTSQTIAGSDFEPTVGVDDFFSWDEATNFWLNYYDGLTDTEFVVGKGYLVAYSPSNDAVFTGTLNNNTVLKSLSYTPTEGDGWNLLGNPYPSAIDWDMLTKTLDVNGTVYVLKGTDNTYDSWNGTAGDLTGGEIPKNNGFFVKAESDGESVTIETADQVHSTNTFLKKGNSQNSERTLKVSIANEIYVNTTYVQFREDATADFDVAIDGYKLFGSSDAPQLFTSLSGIEYSINCLPYSIEGTQLPLGFKNRVASEYTISASGIESFVEGDFEVFLEDTETNDLVNLEEETYTFTAEGVDYNQRFILHFSGITTIVDKVLADEVHIYANGNSVYFRFETMPEDDAQVSVFNIIGQKVYTGEVGQSTLSSIRLNEKPGIYVVRLQSENVTTTQKVMIK